MSRPSQDIKDKFQSHAAYGEDYEVEALLEKYPSLVNTKDPHGCTALWWAVKNGHHDTVELLLDRKAAVDEPDENGDTPFMMAAWIGYYKITQLLLERGVDIYKKNLKGWDAETQARGAGNKAIVNLLKKIKQEKFLKDTDYSRGLDRPIRAPKPIRFPSP
jgi:ankyrin repeat protein